MKTCSKCGESKPLDEFARQKGGRDGRRARCKTCRAEDLREWRGRSPAHEAYLKRNAEELRDYKAQWYRRNGDDVRSRMLSRYWNDPDARRVEKRTYYEAHKERVRDYQSAYYEAHKEDFFRRAAQRRALKRQAPSEGINYSVVYERDGGICGLCGEPVSPGEWHLDHIVPLSRGGSHVYDNVQVAHPRCNLSKGAKLPEGVV